MSRFVSNVLERWVQTWRSAPLLGALFTLACGPHSLDLARTAATPAARHALGKARPFLGAAVSDTQLSEIQALVDHQRAFAWQIIGDVVDPVSLEVEGPSLPRWATWYSRDDIERMFISFYQSLSPEERVARDVMTEVELDRAEAANVSYVLSLESWSAERLANWLSSMNTDERAVSGAGLTRVLYSPAAARHILRNFGRVIGCVGGAGSNETLSPDNRARCFSAEFPADSAIVKTVWTRGEMNLAIPAFNNSAAVLQVALGDLTHGWDAFSVNGQPSSQTSVTMRADSGAAFHLTGLHVMTKQSRDWAWTSVWWTPQPSENLGEDSPLTGAWSNYQMCSTTTFDQVGVVSPELRATYPSLASSLEAAANHARGRSWCSNPYLEMGAGNQATNCIGCHQHAGTGLSSEAIVTSVGLDPGAAMARRRTDFPTDYVWSLVSPAEHLAMTLRDRAAYIRQIRSRP